MLPSARGQLHGGLDVAFLVAADTHFGYGRPIDDNAPIDRSQAVGIEVVHDAMVQQMRALPLRTWPGRKGGKVGHLRGLIVAGDLTDDGSIDQWNRFLAWYGERNDAWNLGIPLFETVGNHDRIRGEQIVAEVTRRHGGEYYALDWGDLHVSVLGEAPHERALAWLRGDLARVGMLRPVVVVLHYALEGPYSVDAWRGAGGPYDQLRQSLQGYRIIGIFHGHYHVAGTYRWNGLDVYRVGSAKYSHHAFAAVHVTDDTMMVALWNTDTRSWWWWHQKRIDVPGDRGSRYVMPWARVPPPEVSSQ